MSLVIGFLSCIRRFVLEQNGQELRDWLLVENNVDAKYFQLGRELRAGYPNTTIGSDDLDKVVDKCLPEEDVQSDGRGSPWPGFNAFMKTYLEYWRDVNFGDLVTLHAGLSDLLTCEAFAPRRQLTSY
jgi:hypothetical protein